MLVLATVTNDMSKEHKDFYHVSLIRYSQIQKDQQNHNNNTAEPMQYTMQSDR